MQRAELVLFDLDGTLLDGAGLPDAMRATCAAVAADLPDVTADDLVAANTAAWQRLWPEVEEEWMLGGRDGDEIGAEVWRATLQACASDDPAVLERALAEWDAQQRVAFRLYDDVLPALDALAAAGVRTGMVTNGSGFVQRLKLDAVGLLDRLDPLVISSEAGVRKPDAEVFGIALHRAGVAPDAAWFVGDHLWHDVEAAGEAGLHTVWIHREGDDPDPSWPRPDATVRSLGDLAGLLPGSSDAGQDPR